MQILLYPTNWPDMRLYYDSFSTWILLTLFSRSVLFRLPFLVCHCWPCPSLTVLSGYYCRPLPLSNSSLWLLCLPLPSLTVLSGYYCRPLPLFNSSLATMFAPPLSNRYHWILLLPPPLFNSSLWLLLLPLSIANSSSWILLLPPPLPNSSLSLLLLLPPPSLIVLSGYYYCCPHPCPLSNISLCLLLLSNSSLCITAAPLLSNHSLWLLLLPPNLSNSCYWPSPSLIVCSCYYWPTSCSNNLWLLLMTPFHLIVHSGYYCCPHPV